MPDELPPDFPKEELPVAATEEAVATTTPPTQEDDEEKYFIRVDTRKWPDEISRLEREDNHFKEVYRARVGQRAARIYKPQIDEWEYRYNQREQEIRKQELENWKRNNPQQFSQELANNPQLARDYHQAYNPDPQQQALMQLERFLSDTLTEAIENGLDDNKAEELYKEVFDGKYGNADLQTFSRQFRANVLNATIESRTGNRTLAPAEQPQTQQLNSPPTTTPTGNPNLANSAPVGTGTRGRAGTKYTKEQIEEWQRSDPLRLLKEFPGPTDFDEAVRSGMIAGMGPNS